MMLAPYRSGPPAQSSEDERREIARFTHALYYPSRKEVRGYLVLHGIGGAGLLLGAVVGELSIVEAIIVFATMQAPLLFAAIWGWRRSR